MDWVKSRPSSYLVEIVIGLQGFEFDAQKDLRAFINSSDNCSLIFTLYICQGGKYLCQDTHLIWIGHTMLLNEYAEIEGHCLSVWYVWNVNEEFCEVLTFSYVPDCLAIRLCVSLLSTHVFISHPVANMIAILSSRSFHDTQWVSWAKFVVVVQVISFDDSWIYGNKHSYCFTDSWTMLVWACQVKWELGTIPCVEFPIS